MVNAAAPNQAPKAPPRRRRGVTIIELIIAVAVLGTALMMLLSVIFASGSLQESTREKAIAYNYIRKLLEEMRSAPFDPVKNPAPNNVYAMYKPGGAKVPTAAALMADLGLNAPAKGPQLEIIFPLVGGVLNETCPDLDLQTPKDLDRSGQVENKDISASYHILPVKIVVHWQGIHKRESQIQICSFLTDNR